jgi:hypothetical protein
VADDIEAKLLLLLLLLQLLIVRIMLLLLMLEGVVIHVQHSDRRRGLAR